MRNFIRLFLLLTFLGFLVNCTISFLPIGEGISYSQSKDGFNQFYFDVTNGIFWTASSYGGGGEIKVFQREKRIFCFSLSPNNAHFERIPINKGDAFEIIINNWETLKVIVKDTLINDFYRVKFDEVVVDFNLLFGQIYYHSLYQESYEIIITNLDGGTFLVDRRQVGCYESKIAIVSNLKRGKKYEVTVKNKKGEVVGDKIINLI